MYRKKFHFSDQNVDRNDPVQLNLLFHQVCHYGNRPVYTVTGLITLLQSHNVQVNNIHVLHYLNFMVI